MSILFPGQFSPLGFDSIALTNAAAQGLTVPAGAKMALVQALTNHCHWRDDGTPPTPVDGGGMYLDKNVEPQAFIGNLRSVEFISGSAGGTTLLVSFYG